MKNFFFVIIISITLIGCGKKSSPEYQGLNIDRKITISL